MTLDDLAGRGLIEKDRSLAGMTTYKFGGVADWYSEVGTVAELELVVNAVRETGGDAQLFVLGRGSNVVVADRGFRGVVVKLAGLFNEARINDGVVDSGAAVSLPRLARHCAAEGRGGLEFYVGIPGSVGGAVVMNAGGHGSDTAEWLIDATILDATAGHLSIESPDQLNLAYRHSRLRTTDIVLSARFRTIPRLRRDSESLMREISSWRRDHQPGGTFNAGSVFKNPPGDAAGRIIDAAGLKGHRVGGVEVSARHANFFVATGEATAQDVHDLVMSVRRLVSERTGIVLTPEIRFIGDFGETT